MLDLKKLEHLNEGSILSWDDILKYRTDIPVLEQIKRGSEKPCIFAPFMGEFGFFINTYVRFIHYFKCPKKIVCCRVGEEIFFPSADEFIYDWNDFQQDKDRIGANIPGKDKQYIELRNELKNKFSPGHEIIEVGHEISYRFIQFMPVPLIPFCDPIEVDVAIGPRNRPRDLQRNYPIEKWQNIVTSLKGWRIGIIGQKETSYDFPEAMVRSWDHERPADAMVSMLQNCKLFIGSDTGTAHVAAMCGCPMVIFRKKDWSTDFVPFMRQQNSNLLFINDGWEKTDNIISESHHILKGEKTTYSPPRKLPKVCLHIPLHIKTHDHAKMLLEKKKLFKDFRVLDIDTIFTIDRDDIGVDLNDVPHIRLHHASGIVKPTQDAIRYFQSRHGEDCFMIRTGQDVQVDIQGLYEHIEWLRNQRTDKAFIAGDYDRHNDIFGVLKEIGIHEKPRMIQFIQGNFMSAPMKMWDKYYLGLPPSVTHYKDDSVMSFCLERDGGKLEKIKPFWKHDPKGHFDNFLLEGKTIEEMYQKAKGQSSDVKYVLPVYEKYASQAESVVEFRRGQNPSTLCFAASKVKSFEAHNEQGFALASEVGVAMGRRFSHFVDRSIDVDLASPVDLLHLDTKHNYDRVMEELTRHHLKVKKFILIHDYETFGQRGDDGKSPGIKQAVSDFVKQHPEWKISEEHKQSNGLVVLSREQAKEASQAKEKFDSELEALFVYRLFLPKPDEEKMVFLRSFKKRLEEFRSKVAPRTKAVMIIDNSPNNMVEVVKKEFGDVFEIMLVSSKAQAEKLSSGQPCSPQRYTLYISSMKVVERYIESSPGLTVFFCEDDYLYRPDAFTKSYHFLKKHPKDFISLYDHPDRYRDSSREKEPVLVGYNLELLWDCGHHWRTSISTCHSFVATVQSLMENADFTLRANLERRDHDMWKEIWKNGKSKLYGSVPGLSSHRRGPHLDDWDWGSIIAEASQ